MASAPIEKYETGLLGWIDARFPLSEFWKGHMVRYYAPKNFNNWYFFWFTGFTCFGASDCYRDLSHHALQA